MKKLTLFILVAAAAVFGLFRGWPGQPAAAQESGVYRAPEGGGAMPALPSDEITDAQRDRIKAEIAANIARLEREGKLEAPQPEVVPLSWPLKKAAGVQDFDVDAIANFVDHNPG